MFFVDWVGELIVYFVVIVIDEGLSVGFFGFFFMDDEGMEFECIVLIKDGVF